MNYHGFEEKKEFNLIFENDVQVSGKSESGNDQEEEDEVTETNDIVVVTPENLKNLDYNGTHHI